jgi:hypothetical protein
VAKADTKVKVDSTELDNVLEKAERLENTLRRIKNLGDQLLTDEEERKWQCVAHWMDCLYQDFLQERIAGQEMPCSSCDQVEHCNGSPLEGLAVLAKKSGQHIRYCKTKE